MGLLPSGGQKLYIGVMEKVYVDEKDFQINPTLLKQIDFEKKCHETTPEGKALWLYIRLCQLLKYDEKCLYHYTRNNMNYNYQKSFSLVEQVNANVPTTCFNFSRIAVKLLNQIPGVKADIITMGDDNDHFRFNFKTDCVAVKAEPTAPNQHLTDTGRVKLGLKPQGLIFDQGDETMMTLVQSLSDKMLSSSHHDLREYLGNLQQLHDIPNDPQIQIEPLVAVAKKCGVDGNSLVQMMFSINHQFEQRPFSLMRVGIIDDKNQINPQLLVREDKILKRIDLMDLRVFPFEAAEYNKGMRQGYMVYRDGYEPEYPGFLHGLEDNGREM